MIKILDQDLVRDIAGVWINVWDGCEWGDVMRSLHMGCHRDYGISAEDCAEIVQIMWRQIESMNGYDDCFYDEDGELRKEAEAASRKLREENSKKSWGGESEARLNARLETLASMPSWVFGENEEEDT